MVQYVREAELCYRRVEVNGWPGESVVDSQGVVDVLTSLIGHRMTESVIVLAFDTHNKLIGYHEVSRGGIAGCAINMVDVYRYAIVVGAAGIVLAHNHPSGASGPSDEDITFTAQVAKASKLLGIKLMDHVIVTDASHYSFLDRGRLLSASRGCE